MKSGRPFYPELVLLVFLSFFLPSACEPENDENLEYIKSVDSEFSEDCIFYFCEIAQWVGDYEGNKRLLVDNTYGLYYTRNEGYGEEIFNTPLNLLCTIDADAFEILYQFFLDKKFSSYPDLVPIPNDVRVSGGSNHYVYVNYKDIKKCVQFELEGDFLREMNAAINEIVSDFLD